MTFMARPTRTIYVALVIVSGLLYFLYAAYTSTYDIPLYRPSTSTSKGGLHSSSLIDSHVKEPTYVNLSSTNFSIKSVTNESKIENVEKEPQPVLSNSSLANPVKPSAPSSSSPPSSSSSAKPKTNNAIQRIPSKNENSSVDYIMQGVQTRNVYDSGFIIPNIEACPDLGKKLQVIIIVTSAPKHVEARMAVRQTWGHYRGRSDVAIVFILGRTLETNLQPDIVKESELYNDIIQGNFVDTYSNLTLKSVAMLEWVDNYCFEAKFILKTDDDMFINIPKLLTFISKHSKDKRKIFGRLARKWKPIRNKASKYYVSVQQYKNPLFPDFTTGPAYLMTNDVIHDLYITALEKTYLKLEDVYTTGIVAQDNKIQRVHVNEFFNKRVALNPCNIQKSISIHMIKTFEQYDLWKKLLDGRSKC